MRILTIILYMSFAFSGELEVQGNLNVTGDINSPTIDALSGMNPDRIYRYAGIQFETKGLAVPEGKFWYIASSIPQPGSSPSGEVVVRQNDASIAYLSTYSSANNSRASISPVIMLSGDIFEIYFGAKAIINIYEYPISGSGTDQGMDFIEP